MHIAWLNQHGSLVGGAEHYIARSARQLRNHDVRSTLFYNPNLPTSPEMLDSFDAAFPLVDTKMQLTELAPDLVFAHQLRPPVARHLTHTSIPVVDFLHDHYLFCLREQKITTLGRKTCEKAISASACYPCIGFIRRTQEFPHLQLRSISDLRSEQDAHKQFRAFITGSQYMAKHAALHGFDESRIHVVPLYAELPVDQTYVDRDPTKLLFVGGIFPSKGLDILFAALRDLSLRVHLDVIGAGTWLDAARTMAIKMGIRNRVSFLGNKDHHELNDHYRKAACLVLPSRSPESFGLVGVEAMSHGTPVIAADVGGIREWLVPGQTGLLVPPNDSIALQSAIRRLIENPKLARTLGEQGRARYFEYFQPERHINRLLSIFSNITRTRACA